MAGKMGQENAGNMLRSELVSILTQKMPHLGGRIEVRGFGSFSLPARPPRKGRNPKTGETVMTPAKAVVHFKPGQELRGRIRKLPVSLMVG